MKCIKFGAKWCGPCNSFAPIFSEVSKNEKYKNIEFSVIDVDDTDTEEDELMSLANVRSIPCTIVIDENNAIIGKSIGLMSKAEFENMLDSAIENSNK